MEGVCRNSFGVMDTSIFNAWTCSLCYMYLFPSGNLQFNFNITRPGLIDFGSGGRYIKADIGDMKSTKFICDNLEDYDDCTRWKDCCRTAEQCCRRQQDIPISQSGNKYCPRTWDGLRCFDDTSLDETVRVSCPGYLTYESRLRGYVKKLCTGNGTWFLHPASGKEWANYSACYSDTSGVDASAKVTSLLLLVLVVTIFLTG